MNRPVRLSAVGLLGLLALSGCISSGSVEMPVTWDGRVTDLVTFVENARGHHFTKPIAVRFLNEATFDRVTEFESPITPTTLCADNSESCGEDKRFDRDAVLYGSFGLSTADTANLNSSTPGLVIGAYDPTTKTLRVRGTTLDDNVRSSLVHELTHALQDQVFDLVKLQSAVKTEDSALALRALIEADAERISEEWAHRAGTEGKPGADAASSGGGGASSGSDGSEGSTDSTSGSAGTVPEGVNAARLYRFAFPYVFGPTYVDQLLQTGGNEAVDAAFAAPPTATSQVQTPGSVDIEVRPTYMGLGPHVDIVLGQAGWAPIWRLGSGLRRSKHSYRRMRGTPFRSSHHRVRVSWPTSRSRAPPLVTVGAQHWSGLTLGC